MSQFTDEEWEYVSRWLTLLNKTCLKLERGPEYFNSDRKDIILYCDVCKEVFPLTTTYQELLDHTITHAQEQ